MDYHLTREEKFLQSIGYPEFERHKRAHENFRKVIQDLFPALQSGDVVAFREALSLAWGGLQVI